MRSTAVQLLCLSEQRFIPQLRPRTRIVRNSNITIIRRDGFEYLSPGRHLERDFDVRMPAVNRRKRLIQFRTDDVRYHANRERAFDALGRLRREMGHKPHGLHHVCRETHQRFAGRSQLDALRRTTAKCDAQMPLEALECGTEARLMKIEPAGGGAQTTRLNDFEKLSEQVPVDLANEPLLLVRADRRCTITPIAVIG